METTPALVLLFSLCAVSAALFVMVIYLVKLKNAASSRPLPGGRFSGDAPVDSAELHAVLDSITDYICIIDGSFHIRYANKSYRELTGRGDAGGLCHEVFWKRASPCEDCPARETLRNGVPVLRKKTVLRTGRDERKHLEISSYPVLDKNNRVVRVVEYIRDMTKEAGMLDELIRSEKLAGIGVMTTSIAHEMNNALSGISGTASNLLSMPEKYGLNEKGVDRVFSVLDSATRATGVMKNLLQFSSPLQNDTRTMINVKQLLKKIVNSAYIQEAPDIERRLVFDDPLSPINADVSKIELVFMNIISNAIRSIQQKKTRNKAVPFSGLLEVSARQKQGSVFITFSDNGVGIPESASPKIFDPFFSAWPGGSGTGLGLSTAMHIVEEHGGRISFESKDDSTTFIIQLPLDSARQPMSREGPA